jgi:hypothetical protein
MTIALWGLVAEMAFFFYVARLLTGRRDSAAGGFDCGLDASTAVNPVL